jgi:tetratricopeptide (TPR) repeat protein
MTTTLRLATLIGLFAALSLAACNRPQTGQQQGPPAQSPPPDAGAAQSSAGPDQGLDACSELGADPTAHIAACTSVIDDPAASPHDRAIALNNRGVTRMQQGDNDGAIADYTAAIALNPQYDAAFYNRAKAWRAKGDDAKADADSAQAVAVNPALKGR